MSVGSEHLWCLFKALSDYTDLLSRRLGFIPLPFACLVFGVLFQTVNIKTTLSIINIILAFFWYIDRTILVVRVFSLFISFSLLASKIALGTILLGISCEYVTNSRKEGVGSSVSVREPTNSISTSTNDPPVVETTTTTTTATTTTTLVGQPLEKGHARSVSLLHLNELVNQKRPSEPPSLAPIEGGDELNETSFRDADDNYQCLINDQNCPPTPNFVKAATPSFNINENNVVSTNSTALNTITNIDEGIVFNAQPSAATTAKKSDLNDVERYKMCGNSIII